MTPALLFTLLGLALVDSVNTSTIWMVMLIILTARRPVATGWAYAVGAVGLFFLLASLLYGGLDIASASLEGLTLWVRRIIFTILAIVLAVMGARRLKPRIRKGFWKLPKWVNPWTAVFLGMLMTIVDLPNAFPLFLAVERLVDSGIATSSALLLLSGYTFIYALPTIAVLILGLIYRERVVLQIERIFGPTTGTREANWKIASLFFAGAIISLTIVFVMG